MKKTIAFLLALALAAAFCACKRKPVETSDSSASGTSVTEPTTPATSETSATTEDTTTEPDYTFEWHMEITDALDCRYMVLRIGDPETDAALEALAAEMFASYVPNASSLASEGCSAVYDVRCAEDYADDKLISAFFGGTYTVTSADGRETNGNVYYTVHVDRASGRLLSGADFITDFDALVQALTAGKFSPGIPSADDLAQYRPEYDIYPYCMFYKDRFAVEIVSPGVTETNTEYSISRADAADFLAEAYR